VFYSTPSFPSVLHIKHLNVQITTASRNCKGLRIL